MGQQKEMEEGERTFANSILKENEDVLELLMQRAGRYSEQGRSDKLYLLVKAVHNVFDLAQARMKQTLGVDPARRN